MNLAANTNAKNKKIPFYIKNYQLAIIAIPLIVLVFGYFLIVKSAYSGYQISRDVEFKRITRKQINGVSVL